MLRLIPKYRALCIKNGVIWRSRVLTDTYIRLGLPEVDVAIGRQAASTSLHFTSTVEPLWVRALHRSEERFLSPRGLVTTSANGVLKL